MAPQGMKGRSFPVSGGRDLAGGGAEIFLATREVRRGGCHYFKHPEKKERKKKGQREKHKVDTRIRM